MSEYSTQEVPNRSTSSHSSHNGRDIDDNKFLKVTPNLFTAERLHLFDSLDLYASLIKSSKSIEHGERLHNLSWRIINKALLKDKNLNKSKKKDGVKNMYYVLNPSVKKQQQQQQQQQPKQSTSVNAAPPLRSSRSRQQSGDTSPGVKSLEKGKKSSVAPIAEKIGSHTPKTKLNKSTTSLYRASQNHKSKKEDPQTIVKGFDPNTIITANKNSSTHLLRTTESNVEDLKQKEKNTFYIGASPSPEPNATTTTTSTNNSHKVLPSRQESLFGKPKAVENHAASNNHSNVFFSSEDEDDSDWDADSLLYDEDEDEEDDKYGDDDDEEEDQYYRSQWDKLLSKNQSHQASAANTSGNNTPTSTASHDQIKRSLLSGLFLNEQMNGNNKSKPTSPMLESPNGSTPSSVCTSVTVPASIPASNAISRTQSRNINSNQRATLGTSTVTAVGSVTPPQRNAFSGTLHKHTSISSRGSFSSIVSESTRERFNRESNAPPAAQTILPTALSTHMFLPNNIHQQRMAAAAAAGSGSEASSHSPIQELRKKPSRRESMDIPSKNRKNTFLKTRMEISEEEKQVRAYPRRNL